ncbi:protein kinase-like protein [Beggiatoa sp. PS]|nr:protein kinase-like protein [Beggiatoa sp. PS]
MLFKIHKHNKRYPVALIGAALSFFWQTAHADITDCAAVTEISTAQCEALIGLYNNTDGPNWRNQEGWLQNNTPCSWYGITCSDGTVTQLQLQSNNLTGIIPELSGFADVQTLLLSYNQLTGSIPELTNLTQLQYAHFNHNQLSGTLPSLVGLTQLVEFSISQNQNITGTIPGLSHLTQLEKLWLDNNNLTGRIPEVSTLTNLQTLSLGGNNKLEGAIPSLPANLEELTLSGELCQDSNVNYAEYQAVEDFDQCPDVFLVAETSQARLCLGHNFTVTIKKQLTNKVDAIQFALSLDTDYFRINSLNGSGVLEQESQNHIDQAKGTLEFTAQQLRGNDINHEFVVATINLTPLTLGNTQLQFDRTQTFTLFNKNDLDQELKGINMTIDRCPGSIPMPKAYSAIWGVLDETAELKVPKDLIFDATGNLYIADILNHRIFKLDPEGNLTVFAGTGTKGFEGDNGPAIEANLSNPEGLAIDAQGNLYIADTNNHRIRKIDSDGIITTVVGTGEAGYAGDNEFAIAAQLKKPTAIVFDHNGHFYIADSGNNSIRKINYQPGTSPLNANSLITTIAGDGRSGYSGDNGPAIQARLGNPSSLVVDNENNLYIADTDNHRIRKIDIRGNITTFAGSGYKGYSGDGNLAITARLNMPTGLAVDGTGNIFIADQNNHRIRKIDGEGIIRTFTGTGVRGTATDGILASVAEINQPTDIALDQYGNLYLAEKGNHFIRKIGEKDQDGDEGAPHCSTNNEMGIPISECYALVALYDSTKGPEWTNHEGWKATEMPCEWFGVTCEGGEADAEKHVTAIDLPNNNLVGPLPSYIGNFIKLQQLDLSENQISGGVPSTIKHLGELTNLNLANNVLIGSLPDELNDALQLQTINFAQNRLSGRIPALGSLLHLETLDLSNNRFSGAVPDLTALPLDTIVISGDHQQLCKNSNMNYGSLPVTDLDICPASNQLPIAAFSATPNKGKAPLTVNLNGWVSRDPFGSIEEFFWESSDGQPLIGSNPTITFKDSGIYQISLRVMDNDGAPSANVAQQIIEVGIADGHVILNVEKDGNGLGIIQIRRDKETVFTCKSDCQGEHQDYPVGSELKLRARAVEGSYFAGWSDDCVGTQADDKITLVMDDAKQCTAVFELEATPPPSMHALIIDSVAADGLGSGGDVMVKDVLCENPPCKSYQPQGKRIKITAVPIPHAYFMMWNPDCPIVGTPMDATNQVVLTSSVTCTAYFGNDSNPNAEDLAQDFEQEGELSTGESVIAMYPEITNWQRYEQVFRFAEKAMMTVEDQKLLDENTWPEHFNDIENWFDPMPEDWDGLYVERVQVKSGQEMIGENYQVDGQYVRVDVRLLNQDDEEELVSILIYYDEEPMVEEIAPPEETAIEDTTLQEEGTIADTTPQEEAAIADTTPPAENSNLRHKPRRWYHRVRRVIRYFRRWRW